MKINKRKPDSIESIKKDFVLAYDEFVLFEYNQKILAKLRPEATPKMQTDRYKKIMEILLWILTRMKELELG